MYVYTYIYIHTYIASALEYIILVVLIITDKAKARGGGRYVGDVGVIKGKLLKLEGIASSHAQGFGIFFSSLVYIYVLMSKR